MRSVKKNVERTAPIHLAIFGEIHAKTLNAPLSRFGG